MRLWRKTKITCARVKVRLGGTLERESHEGDQWLGWWLGEGQKASATWRRLLGAI